MEAQTGMRLGGGQCTTAFDQFGALEIQCLRQQLSDRPRLGDELIDLGDFLGRQLAPTLGRRTSLNPAQQHLDLGNAETDVFGERTIASRSSTRSSYRRR